MSTCYYTRVVMGKRVNLSDVFILDMDVWSCRCGPPESAKFCPQCGQRVARQPIKVGRTLLGLKFPQVEEYVRNKPSELQLINIALTSNRPEDYVFGYCLQDMEVDAHARCLVYDIEALHASMTSLSTILTDVPGRVELYIANFMSF